MIKYSIVIPHKNTFLELKKLLRTVPKDDDIEIIIVDDHSFEEDVFDFKREYLNKKNLKFIESSNQGAGNARNEGILLSSGEWLIFADSDDLFKEGVKEKLDKYCNNDNDLIYFYPDTMGMPEGDYREQYKLLFDNYFVNPGDETSWKIRLNFDVPWSKAVRKELVITNNIWFDNTRKQNDTMFSQKIGIQAKKTKIVKDSTYIAVFRENSISSQRSIQVFEDVIGVRINSYLYKNKYFSGRELEAIDPQVLLSPILTIIESYIQYRNIRYTYQVYRQFRNNKIPVISKYTCKHTFKKFFLKLETLL